MKIFKKRQLSMKTQFFIKSLLVNCLLLLIPISVLAPFSIIRSNREIESSIRKNNWNLLYQIEEHMDSLFKQADNINLYFAHNPSIITHLRRAFRENSLTLDSLNSINTFSLYLQNITNTNNYIHSVYVYYNNTYGRFLSSETARLTNLSGYYDTEWIQSYLHSEADTWYEVRTLQRSSFAQPFRVISVYRKIYSSLAGDHPTGVIVTQFNYERLIEYLNSLELSSSQVIAFLDQDNQMVLQNQETELSQVLQAISFSEHPEEKDNLQAVNINGRKFVVSSLQSSRTEGWRFLSMVPADELYATSTKILNTAVFFMLAAVMVSILIAAVKTQKDYSRLEGILDILQHPERPSEMYPPMPNRSTDPYGYIIRNLLEMFIQQNYLKVQISEKKYKMQTLEMQALQQQINPHFLYNTLHTIYWEAFRMTQAPNTCSKMVSNLADIMEYSLSDSQQQVKLKEELDYLKAYVEIQKVRYGDKFEVFWEVDDTAIIYPTSKMLLQPLVENALYHGIKEKEGSGVIKVKVYFRTDHVLVSILDNGVGMDREQLEALRNRLKDGDTVDSHIGVLNTHRRLVLAYGEHCGLHIGSRKGAGTVVSFRLPLLPREKSI
ncbi:cache domain-containing sensor histidine kinase [Cuneatibacter caecimuris]|uniref:Two-component system sensor histidine kinase YesM n=1 Tax=Cuneatibacter caecimuris TaxID=1796618 RepID=A0A4Q7PUQ9_9FIRM|nr:sensor histidine kinase [Cuneatibacter caecimuris]RZT03070.1 two-component system sensor histidine kinase YesM [Cuneatibacter caecimuris]